jgi:phosphoglycerate dehydrogenase-like enzyme
VVRHRVLYLCPLADVHIEQRRRAAPVEIEPILCHELSKIELIKLLPSVECLISERAAEVDREVIAAGRHLKLIQRIGSLIHDIDVEAARELGVPVAYWPLRSSVFVAEHLLMLVLALLKRARQLHAVTTSRQRWDREPRRTDANTFAYNWSRQREIYGLWRATVGILGMGEIGAELARRLRGFETCTLYYKRRRLPPAIERELGICYTAPEELIAESDVVISLLPYSPETVRYLNAERLARMKPTAILVHGGAGGVVDEQALAQMLSAGRIFGAALDTYEWEPIPPEHPLLSLPDEVNLLLTPHVAAGDPAMYRAELEGYYENPRRALAGEPILYRVC